MSIENDNYAKLKENLTRMNKWANSMSDREDTVARPRSTIKLQFASNVQVIPKQRTGHPGLDILTHGGVDRGRFMILFGGPGQGKSMQAAAMIKEAQGEGIVPLYLAPEGTDRNWLALQGVNLDHMIINDQETDCARVLNTVDEACRGTKDPGKIDLGNPYTKLIIVDSVAALKHVEEEKKGAGGDSMAMTARRLSQYFRNSSQGVIVNGVLVLFINQIRDDMDPNSFEKYPGGNALMHYSSLDLFIRRCGKGDFVESIYKYFFEEDAGRSGFPNAMFVRKTKLFGVPENTRATGIIQSGIGLVKELTLAQFMVEQDLCDRSGATVSCDTFDGTTEGKFKTSGGFSAFVDWVYENYDLAYASARHTYEKKFSAILETRMAKFKREPNIQALPEVPGEKPDTTPEVKEEPKTKTKVKGKPGRKKKGA